MLCAGPCYAGDEYMHLSVDILHQVGFVLLAVLQDSLFGLSVYQSIMSFFGFYRRRRPPLKEPRTRFAVLVPAHNEGHVIADVLDALSRQEYPRDLFDVYVVADNCTDNTADVVRAHGVTVYEREDKNFVGKGHAIGWLLSRIKSTGRQYDMVAMFDADNLISANFLREVDRYAQAGHRAIQGYLDMKNPGDTWISLSYAIGYWYTNRFWDLARSNVGLASMLGGTGSCMAMSLIDEIGWNPHSITEDLEFTIQCVLRGIHPIWAWDAHVYDEKPLTMKMSWNQRMRWMRGHFQLTFQYSGALWRRFFSHFDIASFDLLVYLGQPVWMVFAYLLMLLNVVIQLEHVASVPVWASAGVVPPWLWLAVAALEWFAPPMLIVALIFEKVKPRYWWGMFAFAVYGLTYVPLDFIALFTRNDRTWFHTTHKRAEA
jgi:cellulose synthase/poly-beta-1,6-N-acetylglucosamine synthase-like glycosyltransferase